VAEPPPGSPDFARWLRHTLRPEDFETLPGDDVDALRPFAVPETHPPGTALLRQGCAPEAFFVIEEGEVELVYETRLERLIVMIVGAGASIGDLPVMLETPYPYSAVTRRWTTTLRFGLEAMQTLIELHPHICYRWLRVLSRRMARTQRRLVELTGRSAFEQLILFLLHEAEERESPVVELTQKELAEALTLSRQTVSRVLGLLEREGVIERGHRQVEIRELERLRRYLPL